MTYIIYSKNLENRENRQDKFLMINRKKNVPTQLNHLFKNY